MDTHRANPLPTDWVAARFDDALGPRLPGETTWRPGPRIEVCLCDSPSGPVATVRRGTAPAVPRSLNSRADMVSFLDTVQAMLGTSIPSAR